MFLFSFSAGLYSDLAVDISLELNEVAYGERIVLNCPYGYKPALDQMVAAFVRDGVGFVAIVGKDAATLEDIVDELWIEHTKGRGRTLITSNHPSLEDASEMARSLVESFPGEVQIVEL